MKISAILSTVTVSSRALRMQMHYLKHLKANRDNGGCDMCVLSTITDISQSEQIVWRGENFYVTKNLFPYAVWDGSPVVEHLLLVPNKHIDSLYQLSSEEKAEWMEIASKYEGGNYSIYSRSPGNGAKSIVHQHAHLIYVGKRPVHFRRIKHGMRIVFAKR